MKPVKAWALWCSCRRDYPGVYELRKDAEANIDSEICAFGGKLEVVPVLITEIVRKKKGRGKK